MVGFPRNWDLSLLPHPTSPEFQQHLDAYRHDLNRLASRSDQLPPIAVSPESTEAWVGLLSDFEDIETRNSDLSSLCGCHAAADAANKAYQQLEAALSALSPQRDRILTNIELALQRSDPGEIAAWLAGDARLKRIAFFFEQRRKQAQMRLPREQELLAAELGVDGIHAWGRLYDRLSGELRVKVMERGELVEKSPGQIRFDLPERTVRENNFYAFTKAGETIADSCADAVNHIAGSRLTLYRRLGVDHLEAPLRCNRLQRATLETMWRVVSERKALLLPYLRQKAHALGLERMSWFDLTAPYPLPRTGAAPVLPYDAACARIIDAFRSFSPDLSDFARMALESRWVEAENRAGKRQGAFCTGFPGAKQSRIFMTYKDSDDDASTLAHELGHGYHGWVLRDQPIVLQDYPMNLAETASTFCESVLAEARLRTAAPHEQLEILDGMLSDAVAYLMNIHARYLFEDRFHQERRSGELPAARLSDIMLEAQREAYLDALDPAGWYPGFWISKLHFYISGLPFYNFPYTFGYLLSLGVAAAAQQRGPEFASTYRELLRATGCKETEEAVSSTLGDDLTRPDFWHRSLDVVERRVEKFLALAH